MKMLELRCEKCGALPPKDESKSNENWNVYNTGKGCKCGGRFVHCLIEKHIKGVEK